MLNSAKKKEKANAAIKEKIYNTLKSIPIINVEDEIKHNTNRLAEFKKNIKRN